MRENLFFGGARKYVPCDINTNKVVNFGHSLNLILRNMIDLGIVLGQVQFFLLRNQMDLTSSYTISAD